MKRSINSAQLADDSIGQGIRRSFDGAIATLFGLGLSPKAPGTLASLVTALCFFFLSPLDPGFHLAILAVSFFLGVISVRRYCGSRGLQDPSAVVIDEWVGMGIVAIPLTQSSSEWPWWVVAFALFRFFDIQKPGPVRFFDTLSKKHPPGTWSQAVGVILDDAVAGVLSLILLIAFRALYDFF